jgi:hypothetical protein
MQIQYYIHFQGNKNNVDLDTLVNVCCAFSSLLNAAAFQLLLSRNPTHENGIAKMEDERLVTLSMQQTEKGSCVIPVLVDIASSLDAAYLKDAIDCFLSQTGQIFNGDFWRAALANATGCAILEAAEKIPRRLAHKKAAKEEEEEEQTFSSEQSHLTIDTQDIAEMKSRELLANESVYQATLDLYRALHADSLNTSFSIETDNREIILKASKDQQDVLRSPLTSTVDFHNQIMKIEFTHWLNSYGKVSADSRIKGEVLGTSKTLKLSENSAYVLHEMHLSQGDVFDAAVSGKMMTRKDSGTVFYRDLKIEEIID